MARYNINFCEELKYECEVEADSYDEAVQKFFLDMPKPRDIETTHFKVCVLKDNGKCNEKKEV